MIRNLKTYGLALISALVMSAAFASTAQATEWVAEELGETVGYFTGTQITHNSRSFHVLKAGNSEIQCEEASFVGEIALKQKFITLTPTYNKCKTLSGLPVTITENGCDFTFYSGTQSEKDKNDFFDGATDIKCPTGKEVEIHVYLSAENHSKGSSWCTIRIPEQSTLVANTYTNTTTGVKDIDITTELTITKLEITGSFSCGLGVTEGTYTGATTVKAFTDAAHTKQIGFNMIK